jgi:isopropylmalate/homocitrate/citramalate synthase
MMNESPKVLHDQLKGMVSESDQRFDLLRDIVNETNFELRTRGWKKNMDRFQQLEQKMEVEEKTMDRLQQLEEKMDDFMNFL